jgi:ribosome-associated heat shock protein Hsp15
MNTTEPGLRIDKWLWAARFYKTRQLAIKALNSRQISINKTILKPASTVRAGDIVQIKRGADEIHIEVLGISDKRGPAKMAQLLFCETPQSIEKRQKLREQLKLQPRIEMDHRKPDKRKIRDSRSFKRNG